jgi:transposase
MDRKPYPSDVSDDAWALVAPYLTLMTEEAPQRSHPLREVCKGLRWRARAGAPWRMLPNDLPPWEAASQHTRRWPRAGVCEAVGHDWRAVLRLADGRPGQPSAAIVDSRTLPPTPESGPRAGSDGAQRTRGSEVPRAVDPLGHLLALRVTAASAQERAQVGQLTKGVQEGTGDAVEAAFVDRGSTGGQPAPAAAAHGIQREVVKLPEATQGFVLLPRRWVVERRCAWAARFRRLARDDARLPDPLRGLHFLVCAILMLTRFVALMGQSA